MTRLNTVFLALGAFVTGAVPLAARAQASHAPSGDALAHAEQTCLDHGVGPYTVSFDLCVERAAPAFDRAAPVLAAAEARRIADARETCMSYDFDPMTMGFHQCIARESSRLTYALTEISEADR
jgi:hypothetical protein